MKRTAEETTKYFQKCLEEDAIAAKKSKANFLAQMKELDKGNY